MKVDLRMNLSYVRFLCHAQFILITYFSLVTYVTN